MKLPTPPSAAQSFGIAMHAAMRDFYTQIKSGEKASEKLIHSVLEKNWINQGFENKDHETKYLQQGKKYLSGYLNKGFNSEILPSLMEEKFTVPLPINTAIKIGGVIDRVDVLSDGTIDIVDYKTSSHVPTQREVDKNLQLSFYALAATTLKDSPFGKDPQNVNLSLYFFDTQEKLTTKRTKEDLIRAQEEILSVKKEIEESSFECSKNFMCQNCEFKMFCNLSDD